MKIDVLSCGLTFLDSLILVSSSKDQKEVDALQNTNASGEKKPNARNEVIF